jgi:methylated-DNA-[protein]-cysteine S-methyltransferase
MGYLQGMRYALMDSPLGRLTLASGAGGLEIVAFSSHAPPGAVLDLEANAPAVDQLREYFAGERRDFDLPIRLNGTAFQQRVWRALQAIPYGETCSYGDIARAIGKPGAARAVGMANHQNPISIIVPCHRVIGRDGSLVGYGGGLDVKARLLELERGATATRSHAQATSQQSVLF